MTAMFVAACRGVARVLPDEARLVADPFGLSFGGLLGAALERVVGRAPRVVRPFVTPPSPFADMVVWMQLRTRTIDDELRAFVVGGGRQVVVLGAGFDCRAWRMREALGDTHLYEVDHPATQAKKRRVLGALVEQPRVHLLAWDFEARPAHALPAALAALGHDAGAPTLFIWEGVTMYLHEPAIDATVRAVRVAGAPGSLLLFNYFDRAALARTRALSAMLGVVGEPFRFGWDPPELPAWLAARGLTLVWDRSDDVVARRLPPRWRATQRGMRHVALATVA